MAGKQDGTNNNSNNDSHKVNGKTREEYAAAGMADVFDSIIAARTAPRHTPSRVNTNAPTQTPAVPPDFDSIPQSIRALPHWVLWHMSARNGKPTKIPLQANGSTAKSNTASTWTTFDAIRAAFKPSRHAGIGFVFSPNDPYCGIDLDGCRNPETGDVAQWASEIVERFGTYTEVSPTGTGLKMFLQGEWPTLNKKNKIPIPNAPRLSTKEPALEIYDRGRYFAVTGRRLNNGHDSPEPMPGAESLEWITERYYPTLKHRGASSTSPSTLPKTGRRSPEGRCRAYLEALPDSIEGQDGSGRMFHAACICFKFGLDDNQARGLLQWYGTNKSDPPWDDREIEHKLIDGRAAVDADGTFGAMLVETVELPNGELATPRFEEAFDNTHRLAKLNLLRYRESTPNGTLRFWKNEWYKYDGFCYRKIEECELKAKIGQTVRIAFEQHAAEMLTNWDGETGPMPTVKNVGKYMVGDVLFATAQMQILSGSVTLNSWIDGPLKPNPGNRRYVALRNGILDIDGLLEGEPDHLKPHSPDWFSLTCLPFDFDPDAECDKWTDFLNYNLEDDQERIDVLREWAGYMLLPSTDHQKFLFMEGDGANGKSVYLAAIEAMLGTDNCSHVALEVFTQPFMLTQTLGKLANIASECSEMDSSGEGFLKQFVSGDRMTFNRKGIPPIDANPTARLMIAANVRPRWADKSSGLWRRIIPMPWRRKIADNDPRRILGMDKIQWWEKSGELPGIFNWAISGLDDLTKNKKFTKSKVVEASLADYKYEVNPAKGFLEEFYVQDAKEFAVSCKAIYDHYKDWAVKSGYKPSSDRTFGREVARHFPEAKRIRVRKPNTEERYYAYDHLRLGNKEDEAAAKLEESEAGNENQSPQSEMF